MKLHEPDYWRIVTTAAAGAALRANSKRLWALVRSQRVALFAAGLISTDECAALLADEEETCGHR